MKMVKLCPCPVTKFPDIGDLKFFRSDVDLYYFNAGALLQKSEMKIGSGIVDFLDAFGYLIDAIRERNGLDERDLHVHDASGEEYLEECLVMPFLMYVDRGFGPYLFERMEEMMCYGFTVNDTMVKFFYDSRFDQQSA